MEYVKNSSLEMGKEGDGRLMNQKRTDMRNWQVKEVRLWAINDEGAYQERKEIAEAYLKKYLTLREVHRLAQDQADRLIESLKGENELFDYVHSSVYKQVEKIIYDLIKEEIGEQREVGA